MTTERIITAVIVLLICIGVFVAGYGLADCSARAEYDALLSLHETQHTEVVIAKNKVTSLGKALSSLQNDNLDLLGIVQELKDRPPQIRYITHIETVLQPSDPIIITPELPENYLFQLEDSITVAEFSVVDEKYKFETFALTFRNTVILGEKSTASLVQVASSYNPNTFYEVPSELIVKKINRQKLFEPNFGMGVTFSLPEPRLTGSFLFTFLHPLEELDVAGIRISANDKTLKFGIDGVAYNLGKPLPIITDTWIGAGASVDITGKFSGDITLSTKF
jgi:hypothetical protein